MLFPYPGIFAIDPSDPANIAAESELVIFDPSDASHAPLELTDLDGLPLNNPVLTNQYAFVGAFKAPLDEIGWEAAGLTGIIQSFSAMRDQAAASAQSANDALNEAQAAKASAEGSKQAAIDASKLVGAPADSVIASVLDSEESETRGITDSRYVNREVPLYDSSRAFRKKLRHSLPFQFPGWDEATAIWGRETYPQGFTVDESTNELFIIYSGVAQVVAVYDWATAEFKTAFQLGLGNTQVSEGLGISVEGAGRFLYARTGATSVGKFNISNLPAFGSSLTAASTQENGMGRTMTRTPTGWLVNAGARRDVWIDQDDSFSARGYVTLPVGLTGGTSAADSATSANTPKIQGVCEHEGRIVTSVGGQQFMNQPTAPYGYQGIRVYTKSGALLTDALIDPVVFADVLEPLMLYRPRLIEAEGVHAVDGKLYSLTVTHGWNASEASMASVEGVVIMEEMCADPDALDFAHGAVSSPSPDLRITGAFQQPTNVAGYPVNPITGQQLDSIEKIASYMSDSEQFCFQHYVTASAPIAAPDGSTIAPWNALRITKATKTTVYVEIYGTSGQSLWRCSLSGGTWMWEQPKSSAPQPLVITVGTAAYDPHYWKTDGMVEVDGAVSLAGLAAGVYHAVATLGPGHKPLKYQYYVTTVANTTATANLRVTAAGVIEVQLPVASGGSVMLNTIRFRAA